jgi:putative transposase
MFHLLPQEQATVTYVGIKFQKRHYVCDRALKERWFERAKNNTWNISVAFDKRNVNSIYILFDNGQTIGRCDLLEKDKKYSKYHAEEIADIQKRVKISADLKKPDQNQLESEMNAFMKVLTEEQKEKTESEQFEKGEVNRNKTKNTTENRAAEHKKTDEDESREIAEKMQGEKIKIIDEQEDEFEDDEEEEEPYSQRHAILNRLKKR